MLDYQICIVWGCVGLDSDSYLEDGIGYIYIASLTQLPNYLSYFLEACPMSEAC